MSKHTPGPWKTVSAYADIEVRTDSDALVAVVTPVRCESAENARLIAAAPDMLAALDFLNQCSTPMTGQQEECWILVRAALAKARGELFNA
jgi:hypothetical protein